jgi:soluble lytic murein transglycosylase
VLGQRERAVEAYVRLDREFPASEFAAHARAQAEALAALTGQVVPRVFAEELARAERLVATRAYGDARLALERIISITDAADRPLVDLRLASVNLTQKRYAKVLELAAPHKSQGEKQDEAGYLWAVAARRLGRAGDFVAETRRLATAFPDSRWSERALDELALHYIVQDADDEAAEVYRQIITQFPKGATAERAYWRYGWRQYRAGQLATAAQVFDQGAASFPRSDYRPAYLYWAGRAHAQIGAVDVARARLSVAVSDYGNSYYGRLATEWKTRLDAQARHTAPTLRLASVTVSGPQAAPTAPPAPSQPDVPPMPEAPKATSDAPDTAAIPTDAIVRQLLALEFYDEALLELEYAKVKWGASASLDATVAWIYNRSGDLRRGINTMKRAYPQYMSVEGGALPVDVQRVLFPLQYWDLIKKHSTERGLDPFLVAALVAQESTFQADVRSSANAYGLMQIIPSTGRSLARLEGIKSFTTRSLINPDLNVRLGTAYFKRLIDRFEHPHLALAGYNAGDSRVVRWTAERSALPADEFVEDIPFPETQNYVKRILGTANDYRRVYGALAAAPLPNSPVAAPAASPTGSAAASASTGSAPARKPAAGKKPGAKKAAAATKPARKPATRKAVPKKPTTKAAAKKSVTHVTTAKQPVAKTAAPHGAVRVLTR